MNSLVGEKVSITSDKPQTTRSAVRGILDVDEAQVVFIDTPGYHKPRTLLGERLNDLVRGAWSDVDVVLFVVDGHAGIGAGDERVASDLRAALISASPARQPAVSPSSSGGPSQLGAFSCPVFCVVNKIDALRPDAIAAALTSASRLGDFDEFVPLSARTGEGVDLLRDLVLARLPEGPQYYAPGSRTDQPPPIFVAELVREKLLARTREELPHSIAVVTEEIDERDDGIVAIQARIYVERESQKGIVIGRGGEVLKAVGTEAREEIETLFGRQVFLELRVRVEKDWQRHAHALDRLGFGN